jgi:hypothetical protein
MTPYDFFLFPKLKNIKCDVETGQQWLVILKTEFEMCFQHQQEQQAKCLHNEDYFKWD